ncbi:MAG: hypothetical protein AAGI54_09570 [Planctomycetota bacterium]
MAFMNPFKFNKNAEQDAIQAVRPVAAEDLRGGDYVAVTFVKTSVFRFDSHDPSGDPVRVELVPNMPDYAGRPFEVVSVCLPFVLCKTPEGHACVLDVRQCTLVRLPEPFGQNAFESMSPAGEQAAT